MVLWRLQMSLRKKIALCLALGVGTVYVLHLSCVSLLTHV